MSKKRVLVPIVGQGSVIHIIRTGLLATMREYCTPVVAMLWKDEEVIAELKKESIEVTIFPTYKTDAQYNVLRRKIDDWYFRNILKSPSAEIQKKYLSTYLPAKKRYKNLVREKLQRTFHAVHPSLIDKFIALESQLIKQQDCYSKYAHWIEDLQLNGIFTVTPFLHEVELIARILQSNNGTLIASIHSFDNVTKRGWPAILFDHYFVWNKYNYEELQRINASLKQKITIAGAPQFDFHYKKEFGQGKEEWLKALGLSANKKIILYGGGPQILFPNEPQYLKHLVEAGENGLIDEDAVILFRSHPLDKVERWKQFVGESPFLFYDSAPNGIQKLDYTNVTLNNIDRLVSTLKYSDVHINLCSTMTVDGSVFNKPQIAPYYDEVKPRSQNLLRHMYQQEHFLPILKSNAINFAHSKEHLVELVNDSLHNPAKYNVNCNKCVDEIITYQDGKSTKRVTGKLKELLTL